MVNTPLIQTAIKEDGVNLSNKIQLFLSIFLASGDEWIAHQDVQSLGDSGFDSQQCGKVAFLYQLISVMDGRYSAIDFGKLKLLKLDLQNYSDLA